MHAVANEPAAKAASFARIGQTDTDGTLVCSFDPARILIRVEAKGRWTPEQVDHCFVRLGRFVRDMRARHRRVRVLVDRRETQLQTPETCERLLYHTQRAHQPDDRVAILVDNSLAKIEARRFLDPRNHMVFVSERAALMWLGARD